MIRTRTTRQAIWTPTAGALAKAGALEAEAKVLFANGRGLKDAGDTVMGPSAALPGLSVFLRFFFIIYYKFPVMIVIIFLNEMPTAPAPTLPLGNPPA